MDKSIKQFFIELIPFKYSKKGQVIGATSQRPNIGSPYAVGNSYLKFDGLLYLISLLDQSDDSWGNQILLTYLFTKGIQWSMELTYNICILIYRLVYKDSDALAIHPLFLDWEESTTVYNFWSSRWHRIST